MDPQTVFAPTNEAFMRLGAERLDAWVADPEALRRILFGHIAAGRIPTRLLEGRERVSDTL